MKLILPHQTLLITVLIHATAAYNILGIFPTMSKSHYIAGEALMRGLAAAGHNVTSISPFPQKSDIPNFRDYPIIGIVEESQGVLLFNVLFNAVDNS